MEYQVHVSEELLQDLQEAVDLQHELEDAA